MMVAAVSAERARRTLLVLSFTRWFPVGLIIGLTALLMLQRGMGLTEIGLILAVQGVIMLALELPTGGLADAIGRRPVLVLAGIISLISAVLFISAQTFAAFVVATALQGIFRALDSGPLEAWYVDTAQADDPAVPVQRALSHAATVLGLAIAGGALASGGLVAWHPIGSASPLLPPFWVAIGFNVLHLVLGIVLIREPNGDRRRGIGAALASARQAPLVVRDGLRLLVSAPVLRCLVLVEIFWGVAMIAFETLNTIRMAELVGGEERAGVVMGPVSSAAWGLFAVGAWLGGVASRRIGVGWTALLARVLNGAFVVLMGLAAGPAGLIAAFLVAYALHGSAGPVHSTLLHRQANQSNRATVLSMNSMVAGGAYSLGLIGLGLLAEHTSVTVAILVAGAFSVLGAVLYLPAIRQERTGVRSAEVEPSGAVVAAP